MDDLVRQYAEARGCRPLLQQLPDGLREHCLLYEQMVLSDIRVQSGRPDLSEDEVLTMARPTIWSVIQAAWPVVSPLIVTAAKKYGPVVATSSAAGAAVWAVVAPLLAK